MTPLNPTDQLFLWLEKRQQPMHVGGLQLFSFPEGAPDDYVAQLRFGMELTCDYLFLMRDRGIFDDPDAAGPPSPTLVAALGELRAQRRKRRRYVVQREVVLFFERVVELNSSI